MATCPYTWFKGLFQGKAAEPGELAKNLHVRVVKDAVETVRVALPARSARWLIDLIPEDVVLKIRAEKIPLDDILEDLRLSPILCAREIFSLKEAHRQVDVWLE